MSFVPIACAGGGTGPIDVDTCAAPALASAGLCLADGTPIAVLFGQVTSDVCAEPLAPVLIGWVNLLTGALTPGAPPAGSVPCGEHLDFELTGILCDTLPDGSVVGTAVIQYEYDEDTGQLIGTTILDATTGLPYVPQGVLQPCGQTCPDSEFLQLCDDTLSDGTTIVPFLRRIDVACPAGTVTVTDTTLNAVTPYVVVGTIGACSVSCSKEIYVQCRCDDTDGDQAANVTYKEVWSLDPCTGLPPELLGTFDEDFAPYNPVNPVDCGDDAIHFGEFILCDDQGLTTVQFLRKYLQLDDGSVQAVVDLDLDGQPYTVLGTVGSCDASTCANTTSLIVCDDTADVAPNPLTATDTDPTQIVTNPAWLAEPGAAPLWAGGAIVMGPDAAGSGGTLQTHRYAAAILQQLASCDPDGDVALTISVDVENTGPNPQCGGGGYLRLYRTDGTFIAGQNLPNNISVGGVHSLSVTSLVTAADLAAGNIVAVVNNETFQDSNTAPCAGPSPKAWTVNNFQMTSTPVGAACTTAFLRHVTIDCEGNVVTVTDTEIDGVTPYVVQGAVTDCAATDQGTNCNECDSLLLCDDGADPAVPFLRTICRDCTGLTTSATDTELDGLTPYTLVGAAVACSSSVTVDTDDNEQEILCDSGTDPGTPFLRRYLWDADGTLLSTLDLDLNGAPYVLVGLAEKCIEQVCPDAEFEVLCDVVAGVSTPFLRRLDIDCDGVVATTDTALDGTTPFAPAGTVGICGDPTEDVEVLLLCDVSGGVSTAFQRRLTFVDGTLTATADFTLAGAPYVTVGVVGACHEPTEDVESLLLCDVSAAGLSTPFERRRTFMDGILQSSADFNLAGAPYAPSGTVGVCSCPDRELEILCSTSAGVVTPFLRRYSTNCAGAVTIVDTLLDGTTAFVPVAVGRCPEPTEDAEIIELCDVNAGVSTPFLRRFLFIDGALTSTTNTTLDGVTPYVPTGTVGLCTLDIDRDVEQQVLCDTSAAGVVTPFIRRYLFLDGVLSTTTDLTLAGVPYVVTGTVGECLNDVSVVLGTICFDAGGGVIGEAAVVKCEGCDGGISFFNLQTGALVVAPTFVDCCTAGSTVIGNPTIDSTVQRQAGVGLVNIPAGARSVTVVVTAGSPTVSLSGGAAVTLTAGMTLTWAVDQGGDTGETLQDSFAFTGVAGSDFVVTSTREI